MTLPDLGTLLKQIHHCATPGCKGNLIPKCEGLGGTVLVNCCCDGCSLKGAVSHDNRNVISTHIQVGFICASITHAV